jgi:cytochrome c-type biogenesis protein CcmF
MTSLAGLGRPSLVAALCFGVLAVALGIVGAHRRRTSFTAASTRAITVMAGFVVLAMLALVQALINNDFSYAYVASYSSRSLAGPYTIAALWGGVEGSLLFWTVLLTVFSTLALRRAPTRTARLVGWAAAVLATIALFFIGLLLGPADPFKRLADIPAEGSGLNPLLQSPGMLFHPPLLYTGYVGFSIPFAFAMGALLTGRLDDSWFTATRRWTLFAWSALSVGIVVGGAWGYTELGWGGYWAWDPVENASFMPWLTATAFLHSVVIQEKRRMFKVWNVVLILLTYVLAVFGTFLTRSGILSSIHAFATGGTGSYFLPFLALMLIGGLAIVAARADKLRSENRLDSLFSRESAFLLNNVLFVAAAFTVFWGTLYPIVAEAVSGARLSVGPPFFNSVFVPVGLAIIGLTGIGPLISWRRMSKGAFGRVVRGPVIAGAAVAVGLGLVGVTSVGTLLAFSLSAFTAAAVVSEFVRGSRVYRSRGVGVPAAVRKTLTRNRRRYGGYVVHLGIVLMVIGFAGTSFNTETSRLLDFGESMKVGAYTLVYDGVEQKETPEKEVNAFDINVFRGGRQIAELWPQRNFHFAQRQGQSEVAIRTTPVEDLYVVVTSLDADGTAAVRAFINPLTWWIWAGAAVMLLGMVVVMSGDAPVPAPATISPSVREPAAVT